MAKHSLVQRIKYWSIRFLSVAVPAALVILPAFNFDPRSFAVVVVIPLITTADKWMRNQGWYSYHL